MKEIQNVRTIQKLHIETLEFFSDFCSKNKISFFLSNGTLLGAVKYKKFIPWDDDVDILMPRKDYDRLVKVLWKDNKDFTLMSKERFKEWKFPFAKLSRNDTVIKELSSDYGCECGLAIDIFPVDNWSGDEKKAKRQAKYCSLLMRFLSASTEKNFYTPKKGFTKVILFFIWIYSRILGSNFHYNRIMGQIKKGQKNNNSQFVGSISWTPYGIKEVIPRDVFSETIFVEFEGKKYPAPKGYDYYLRSMYGEYEDDPPLEKQKSNHFIKVWFK